MEHLSRIIAIAISAVYGLGALSFLLVSCLQLLSFLMQPAQERAIAPLSFVATIFAAIGAVFSAAAVGLFKERRWARWPFLVIALLALVVLVKSLPVASGLLNQFRYPTPGAYVVLTDADLFSILDRYFLPNVWLFLSTAASAAFVFHRTR